MNVDIKSIDTELLKEKFEEFILLKNYNSSLHFDKGDIDRFNRQKTEELFEYLRQQKAYVFGAFEGDNLIGFIWGYPRIFFNENRIFINSLVVSKKYAKQGLGKRLIDTLAQFAKHELDCDALDVTVAPANVNAVGFYDHLGFKPERIQMRIGL